MNRITLGIIGGMGLLVISLVTLTFVAPPVLAAADDITGSWEMTMDFGGRPSFAQVSIARGADGGLTGKWAATTWSMSNSPIRSSLLSALSGCRETRPRNSG